jgi:hypothetical protein
MDAEEPPILLDGARVVRYAIVDNTRPGLRSGVVAGGVPVDFDVVTRIVMAEDLVDGSVLLMHCNAEWSTVAAERLPDLESAQRTADAAYAGVGMSWTVFRDLTPQEEREVQITRTFLRELANEFRDA